MGMFWAIMSDWSMYKDSCGTQKLPLYIVMSCLPEFNTDYSAYIIDEFLLFLGHILEGQTGPHIDRARQQFEFFELYVLRPRSLLIALSLSYRVLCLLPYHCILLISCSVLYVYYRPVYTRLCGPRHPLFLLGQYALQAKPHLPILDIIPTHIPGPSGRVTQQYYGHV